MAKQIEKKTKKKLRKEGTLPLTASNYKILLTGVILIIIGYITLTMKPWDGFFPLILSPILLVLGYCVVIPFGILYRNKETTNTSQETSLNKL